MKAVVYERYGPPEVLKVTEVEKPVPSSDQVLIRVYASTLNRTDTGFRSAKYFISRIVTGLIKPKRPITGSEFAGKVEEVGADVTGFAVGDKVFGFDDVGGGAHAEYVAKRADSAISRIPDGFDYEVVAAASEGATYALNVIDAAGVKTGQQVLVYGASGAIGSAAVQILKYRGAHVTAVCGTNSIAAVNSLGADNVVNYQKVGFTDTTDRFDFVFDAVGKSSYGVCKKLLKPQGKYSSTELGRGGQNPLFALWFAITGSRKVLFPIPKINKEKIEYIKLLLEFGAYKPLIDRTYTLEQVVEASRYVESGQKIGNVVIKVI